MGKNSSGCTVGKTCVVILRNSFFFLLALLHVQAQKKQEGYCLCLLSSE